MAFNLTLTRNLIQTLSLIFARTEKKKYQNLNLAKAHLKFNVKTSLDGRKLTKKIISQMCKDENYEGPTYNGWVAMGRSVAPRRACTKEDSAGNLTLSTIAGMSDRYHPVRSRARARVSIVRVWTRVRNRVKTRERIRVRARVRNRMPKPYRRAPRRGSVWPIGTPCSSKTHTQEPTTLNTLFPALAAH